MTKKISDKFFGSAKRLAAFALAAALALTAVCEGVNAWKNYSRSSMVITLNYESARNGLTPGGSRFDISEIKSDKVLKRAIELLGDESLSIEELKKQLTIYTKTPQSSINNVSNAIASGTSYSYCPSEFDISYKQPRLFSKHSAKEFLEALSRAYREHFMSAYSDKSSILKFDKSSGDLEGYDYYETYEVLKDKVGSMLVYLNNHAEENSAYRSPSTGYSFANIITMLINIRDVDLAKLEAYIVQNSISTDRRSFVRKQNYSIEKNLLGFNKAIQASNMENETLDIYNGHLIGVAFIPSIDDKNEFYMAKTKTGLDDLVEKSYSDGITATNIYQKINRYRYLITKFDAEGETENVVKSEADKMIADISEYLDMISTIAIQTDEDYIAEKNNGYITFIFKNVYLKSYAVSAAKYFVCWLVLIAAAALAAKAAAPRLSKAKALLERERGERKEKSEGKEE